MARTTKLELEQINATLAEENALLRSRISDLEQVATRLAEHNDKLAAENKDLHAYIDYLEGERAAEAESKQTCATDDLLVKIEQLEGQLAARAAQELRTIEQLDHVILTQGEEIAQLKAQLTKSTQARREDVDYLSKLHAAREEAIRTGKTVRVQ